MIPARTPRIGSPGLAVSKADRQAVSQAERGAVSAYEMMNGANTQQE